MADRPGRPEEDGTKTSDASPVPAGQEAAAKAAAAPEAANESDATNPQTDRATAGTEEKPEPSGSARPAQPADAGADESPAAPSAATPDVPDGESDAPAEDTTGSAAADEPAVNWEARATAAERELAGLKLKVSAQNAAAEVGLPPEAAQFLRGDNDEEIKAAAETLASLITPSNPLDRNPVPRGQEPDDRPDLATIGARLFRN